MPSPDIDALETVEPGFLTQTIADWQSEIEARLRKRYTIPFPAPVPAIAIRWLVKLVTRDAYAKRGFNPGSAQDEESINTAGDKAEAEIKEAADSVDGLFDLPLRDDLGGSGISQGGPLAYSEQSPYVAFDQQACTARNEDRNGRGSS